MISIFSYSSANNLRDHQKCVDSYIPITVVMMPLDYYFSPSYAYFRKIFEGQLLHRLVVQLENKTVFLLLPEKCILIWPSYLKLQLFRGKDMKIIEGRIKIKIKIMIIEYNYWYRNEMK
ncbi:hypothetical protein J6895_03349 [Nakaseomyces glabratus]|nr:hypothetical protein J6895_03349 [Nakaseomyces glabratus]